MKTESEQHSIPAGTETHAPDSSSATDPVCGMSVDTSLDKPTHTHNGQNFHFCSQGCHDKFVGDPEHYLSGAHRKAAEGCAVGDHVYLSDASRNRPGGPRDLSGLRNGAGADGDSIR